MDESIPQEFLDMDIIEDSNLLVLCEPVRVERSWKERLFSRPWRPHIDHKYEIQQTPDPDIYVHDGVMIAHPVTAKALRESIKQQNLREKYDHQD